MKFGQRLGKALAKKSPLRETATAFAPLDSKNIAAEDIMTPCENTLVRAERAFLTQESDYQSFAAGLPEIHLGQVPLVHGNGTEYCRHCYQANGEAFMLIDEPVDILVVEDNDNERASIVVALQASIDNVQVVAVGDGPEALDFLFARGVWTARAGADYPKLILLDLELPGSDGFSVLGQIRSVEPQDALTLTPVVIFTDSQSSSDITRSYRCGANSYIMKPLSFPDFQAVVQTVGQYWMKHNRTSS